MECRSPPGGALPEHVRRLPCRRKGRSCCDWCRGGASTPPPVGRGDQECGQPTSGRAAAANKLSRQTRPRASRGSAGCRRGRPAGLVLRPGSRERGCSSVPGMCGEWMSQTPGPASREQVPQRPEPVGRASQCQPHIERALCAPPAETFPPRVRICRWSQQVGQGLGCGRPWPVHLAEYDSDMRAGRRCREVTTSHHPTATLCSETDRQGE